MTTTETLPDIPAGYMMDSKGRLVPEHLVRPQAKLEDQLVRKVIGHAEELNSRISRFRGHCFDDFGAFLDLLRDKYQASRGGKRGNMTFTSYDGTLKVQVAVADRILLGPELQIAKELVDECIAEWSEGANDKIRLLVQNAFRTDQEGKVNREAVFALRRIEIDDERWRKAMEAISDSIRVLGSKTYVRFYRRVTQDAPWRPVTIDLASA